MLKKISYLFISLIFALIVAVFQRITGPTYPVKGTINVDGRDVKYKLPRSCTIKKNECVVYIYGNVADAYILWKRLGVDEEFKRIGFNHKNGKSIAIIPDDFAPASKIEYDFFVGERKVNLKKIILRFKGEVKSWAIITHIIFLFLSFSVSFYLFLEIVFEKKFSIKLFWLNYISMFIGGLVVGPIIQKDAFGVWWSGFPFGYDMTDNKFLLSFIFWSYAAYKIFRGYEAKKTVFFAFFITLLTYLIPHSLFGSEYDYKTGKLK